MGRVCGVVVISGANRGIGLELTRSLILNEAVTRVYAGCRNSERAEVTFAEKRKDLESPLA